LVEVTLPSGLTVIEEWAFSYNQELLSILLPNGISHLGNGAFADCSKLESIVIPINVENIGHYAFSNCNALTIYIEAADIPSGWSGSWNETNCPYVLGYVAD
jgi:hypothetical protein